MKHYTPGEKIRFGTIVNHVKGFPGFGDWYDGSEWCIVEGTVKEETDAGWVKVSYTEPYTGKRRLFEFNIHEKKDLTAKPEWFRRIEETYGYKGPAWNDMGALEGAGDTGSLPEENKGGDMQ